MNSYDPIAAIQSCQEVLIPYWEFILFSAVANLV